MNTAAAHVEAHFADRHLRRPGPAVVEVRLTNIGDQPIIVNARLAPGYCDSPSREVFAKIYTAHSGHLVGQPALQYDRHPPVRADYVKLLPGRTLTTDFDLLNWYRLPGPGEYELIVFYQADEPLAVEVPGLLRGIHASERVAFVLEA
jgi:hypothetical protein